MTGAAREDRVAMTSPCMALAMRRDRTPVGGLTDPDECAAVIAAQEGRTR